MIRKRRMMICLEGWYYLFVLGFIVIGAMLRDINLLIMVAGMMVGPLLYNWRAVALALRHVHAERKLPKGICAGDLLVATIVLSNASERHGCSSVLVEDVIRREEGKGRGERTRCSVLFSHVPAGETRTATYSGRLERRGRYQFKSLRISTRFPLGLVRHTVTVAAEERFTVYPRLGRLTDRWTRMHQDAAQGSQRVRQKQGALEGEFFGLRDWRAGDSRRWIHWRTSARRGTLAVRQFERQRNQDLMLLVDLWRPASATPQQLEHVELAISFAATALADLCRRGGCKVGLGIAGREVELIQGVASQALLAEMMELLALAEPTREERTGELLAKVEASTSARSVLVSTRPRSEWNLDQENSEHDTWSAQFAAGRLIGIDVGSDELSEYYWPE